MFPRDTLQSLHCTEFGIRLPLTEVFEVTRCKWHWRRIRSIDSRSVPFDTKSCMHLKPSHTMMQCFLESPKDFNTRQLLTFLLSLFLSTKGFSRCVISYAIQNDATAQKQQEIISDQIFTLILPFYKGINNSLLLKIIWIVSCLVNCNSFPFPKVSLILNYFIVANGTTMCGTHWRILGRRCQGHPPPTLDPVSIIFI